MLLFLSLGISKSSICAKSCVCGFWSWKNYWGEHDLQNKWQRWISFSATMKLWHKKPQFDCLLNFIKSHFILLPQFSFYDLPFSLFVSSSLFLWQNCQNEFYIYSFVTQVILYPVFFSIQNTLCPTSCHLKISFI